jgi:hypothetical protein
MTKKKDQPTSLAKTRLIHLLWAVAAIIVSYFIGSRAFDTGSWWEYLATLVFFILGIKGLILFIKPKQ